ncbi:type 2 isopentenyl-diphosphate Delta-isomerase [Nocardia sp. NBC_01499]|uniref:type 2 isopentenyl-diphosphate Delta-isomerase n=1 Tax=Nocardia sp. NBC_01499 TaxID=2903597 RepID=UPI00386EA810
MIGDRKDDHVDYAIQQQRGGAGGNDFDAVSFVHHALAGIDLGAVSLAAGLAGKPCAVPLFINGMTGGSTRTGIINRDLAIAARETGLPIASGSVSAYLRDSSAADTYRVLRKENPHGFVMANINAATTVEDALRAIDLLEADALQIHLNAVQEIVMPEGDRDFDGWQARIEQIAAAVPVPVIVKEVGFGLSRETVLRVRDLGVAAADVGGRGGTNFARIENSRRPVADYTFIEGWGQSTAACLLDATGVRGVGILASGGVRSALDVARSLALGAAAVGVAGPFLRTLVDHGVSALIDMIETWLDQLRRIMTVLGAHTPAGLAECDLLIGGDLREFCRMRGIDADEFAVRSRRRNPDRPNS